MLPIKYFGFASYGNSSAQFFYDCDDENALGENAYRENDIESNCRYAESNENEFKDFFQLADITAAQSQRYIINIPFYIQADSDAHILFSMEPKSNPDDFEYEIGN